MHSGGQRDRSGAVMGGNGHMKAIGHGGNFTGFGEAAAPGQIKDDDAQAVEANKGSKISFPAQGFTHSDGCFGGPGDRIQTVHMVHENRIFDPMGIKFF